MSRTREEKLLDPKPGSHIAAAREYGIDLSLIVENLKLTPSERLRRNEQAANDLVKFQAAMKKAKEARNMRR